MSETTRNKPLRTARTAGARRGKLKKTRTKNTRFGLATVQRKPTATTAVADNPSQQSAKKKAATRKVAAKTQDNVATARAVSITDTSVLAASTPATEKSNSTSSTAGKRNNNATAPAREQDNDNKPALHATSVPAANDTGKESAAAVTTAQTARSQGNFWRRPLMIGALFAVIVLLGYRHWFGGQETEELAVRTIAPVPVPAARTIEIAPAAPVANAAPPPAMAGDREPAPAAPTHKWQYRPASETASTAYGNNVVAAHPEIRSPVPAPTSAASTGQPTPAPVAPPTTEYGYNRQQHTWPQPDYPPRAYPGYQYRYR